MDLISYLENEGFEVNKEHGYEGDCYLVKNIEGNEVPIEIISDTVIITDNNGTDIHVDANKPKAIVDVLLDLTSTDYE